MCKGTVHLVFHRNGVGHDPISSHESATATTLQMNESTDSYVLLMITAMVMFSTSVLFRVIAQRSLTEGWLFFYRTHSEGMGKVLFLKVSVCSQPGGGGRYPSIELNDWMGVHPPPPEGDSTCYAAVGMLLAFTQEDFLVDRLFLQLLVPCEAFQFWAIDFTSPVNAVGRFS